MGANTLNILNYLDSGYRMVGRKALNSLLFLLFSSPSLYKFSQHPNVFINLDLDGIHRSDLPLLGGRGSNLQHLYVMAMLSTFEERISSLSNFSSTLLLKAFWVVIKSLSKVSSSKVEFLVIG